MKIEKYAPSMVEEEIFCKSTHETIPFPLWQELIEESEAIKAMWCESFPDEPFIKDEILQTAWNAALLPWLETANQDAWKMISSGGCRTRKILKTKMQNRQRIPLFKPIQTYMWPTRQEKPDTSGRIFRSGFLNDQPMVYGFSVSIL
jgi:hypothetical protein